jgi:hypothetical protein
MNSVTDVKKKLALCWAFSILKDEKVSQNDKSNNSESPGWVDERNNYMFSRNVQPWDVLVINKWEPSDGWSREIWNALLDSLKTGDVDLVHSLIVSRIDSDGTVWVTHSGKKVHESWLWVEEVKRDDYRVQYKSLGVLALKMPKPMIDSTLTSVRSKIWKPYDKLAAASTALWGHNIAASNNAYNCVELIADSIPSPTVKKFTLPDQFLTAKPPIFTPSYMTTIGETTLS